MWRQIKRHANITLPLDVLGDPTVLGTFTLGHGLNQAKCPRVATGFFDLWDIQHRRKEWSEYANEKDYNNKKQLI